MDSFSGRGRSNITEIMSRVPKKLLQDSEGTPDQNDCIDMSMAENWLIRDEVLAECKLAISRKLQKHHFDWPKGFWGNTELLGRLAALFNEYFCPRLLVHPSQIAVAPGAAFALDALLYNICNPGDGVLIPAPYWNGYDVFLRLRASVTPIPITVPDIAESMTDAMLRALEKAWDEATCSIKALIISNPHNPLGKCYSKSVLGAYLEFCQRRNIHLISDEVFALTSFKSADQPNACDFVSALAIDPAAIGCDPWRIHVVWSMSKALGCSGIKIGCTITQQNDDLRNGLALGAHMNVSTLSSVFAVELLSLPTVSSLVRSSSERLGRKYSMLTTMLNHCGISYVPCNAGVSVLVRVAPHAVSWDEESAVVERLRHSGVAVAPGRTYHMFEKGWVRISFAVEDVLFDEALKRLETVLSSS